MMGPIYVFLVIIAFSKPYNSATCWLCTSNLTAEALVPNHGPNSPVVHTPSSRATSIVTIASLDILIENLQDLTAAPPFIAKMIALTTAFSRLSGAICLHVGPHNTLDLMGMHHQPQCRSSIPVQFF